MVDRDGKTKTAFKIEVAHCKAAGSAASSLRVIRQTEPRGYGDVIKRAPAFSAVEPFIRFVGDHLFVSATAGRCVEQLVAAGPS